MSRRPKNTARDRHPDASISSLIPSPSCRWWAACAVREAQNADGRAAL